MLGPPTYGIRDIITGIEQNVADAILYIHTDHTDHMIHRKLRLCQAVRACYVCKQKDRVLMNVTFRCAK